MFSHVKQGPYFLGTSHENERVVSQAPILVSALFPFSSGFNNLFPTTFPYHRQMAKCNS